jgi:hypothetical protein
LEKAGKKMPGPSRSIDRTRLRRVLRRFTFAGALGGVAYGFCVSLAASFFYVVDFRIGTGAVFLTSAYGLFYGAALGFGAGVIWAALAWAYRSACARKRENGGSGRS